MRHASGAIGHRGSEGSPERGLARDIDGVRKQVHYGQDGNEQLGTHSASPSYGMTLKQAVSQVSSGTGVNQ